MSMKIEEFEKSWKNLIIGEINQGKSGHFTLDSSILPVDSMINNTLVFYRMIFEYFSHVYYVHV